MSKQKLGKKLNFNILESTTKKKVEKYKSRKVENQKSRKVEKQSNWKTGKTQISLWLPTELIKNLKLQAAKENKKLSAVAAERLKSRKPEGR